MLPLNASTTPRPTVILFAVLMAAMMPLSTDVYLIVMPAIARDFGASLAATQASMAAFALGFGLAHLFVGMLADRYGRRPVAIGGTLLFLLATVAVVQAPTLGVLTACRFLQGFCIATCPILSRAIIRDCVAPQEAARTYALVNAIAGIAPLTAPALGALAAGWGGWRYAIGLLLIYGVVLAWLVIRRLPETRPAYVDGGASPLAAAGEILTHRGFLLGCATSTLMFSALFTWLTTSPFLMIDRLGYSTGATAVVLGLGSGGYMLSSLASARLAARHRPERMIVWGAALMLAGASLGLIALSRPAPSPAITLAAILPFYIGIGFAHANALQIVMRPFAHVAAQASAWLGLLQQIGAVLVSLLAVQLGAGLAAIGVVMACCTLLLATTVLLPRFVPEPKRAY